MIHLDDFIKQVHASITEVREMQIRHRSFIDRNAPAFTRDMADMDLDFVVEAAQKNTKALHELFENFEYIQAFEEIEGGQFDARGPMVTTCDHCGRLYQFAPDHTCPAGTQKENHLMEAAELRRTLEATIESSPRNFTDELIPMPDEKVN